MGDSLFNMLIKLEKRLIALEMAMKITPNKENLLHPKAWRQAKTVEDIKIAEESTK